MVKSGSLTPPICIFSIVFFSPSLNPVSTAHALLPGDGRRVEFVALRLRFVCHLRRRRRRRCGGGQLLRQVKGHVVVAAGRVGVGQLAGQLVDLLLVYAAAAAAKRRQRLVCIGGARRAAGGGAGVLRLATAPEEERGGDAQGNGGKTDADADAGLRAGRQAAGAGRVAGRGRGGCWVRCCRGRRCRRLGTSRNLTRASG